MGRAAFQVLVLPFRLAERGEPEFAIPLRADDRIWQSVPQYFFGCDVTGFRLTLSGEHTEIGWLSYEQAHERLRYDGSKVALWELAERLRMNDLPLEKGTVLRFACRAWSPKDQETSTVDYACYVGSRHLRPVAPRVGAPA